MKKSTIIISLGILISCSSATAFAQGKPWKCPGNYYTNDSQEAKKIGGCELVTDGSVTVINKGGGGSYSSGGGGGSTTAKPPINRTPTGGIPQISAEEQSNRDQGAKRLLENELQNEKAALAKLQQEYNNGTPARLLSEANDDSLYQIRVDRMGREIGLKTTNIVAIENELARHQ